MNWLLEVKVSKDPTFSLTRLSDPGKSENSAEGGQSGPSLVVGPPLIEDLERVYNKLSFNIEGFDRR